MLERQQTSSTLYSGLAPTTEAESTNKDLKNRVRRKVNSDMMGFQRIDQLVLEAM